MGREEWRCQRSCSIDGTGASDQCLPHLDKLGSCLSGAPFVEPVTLRVPEATMAPRHTRGYGSFMTAVTPHDRWVR